MKTIKPLTEEQQKYIKDNYNKLSISKMYKHLKIDKARISRFLKENNLFGLRPKNVWKDTEIDFLKTNIKKHSIKAIAKLMKKSSVSVSKKLHELGYSEFLKQREKESFFKKGSIPFSKGKKQTDYASPEAIERMKKGQFKNGHKPHNTNEIGYETFRSDKSGRNYIFIKTETGMRLKQVHIWEQANGKVPKGHKVVFKDGNTMNCNIDNLELLSNAQLLERNSLNNYPKDIIEIIRIKSKINKQIRNYESRRED